MELLVVGVHPLVDGPLEMRGIRLDTELVLGVFCDVSEIALRHLLAFQGCAQEPDGFIGAFRGGEPGRPGAGDGVAAEIALGGG